MKRWTYKIFRLNAIKHYVEETLHIDDEKFVIGAIFVGKRDACEELVQDRTGVRIGATA